MTKELNKYHYVWLKSHPEYDEQWLKTALSIGFDVHHIDADRCNDHPDNLIMIECRDHMALHESPNLSRMASKMTRTLGPKARYKRAPKSIEVHGFELRLKILGLNKVSFGNRIGIHKNTVNKWGINLPFYAYTILTMLEDIASLKRQCEGWLKPNKSKLDEYESRLDKIDKEMQKYIK